MIKFAIFGVPRSGTSWLSQIFNGHPDVLMRFQPLFSYGHKGRLSQFSSSQEIYDFFEEISRSNDEFVLMRGIAHKGYPRFSKSYSATHIAFKETRYLHVVENMMRQCQDIKIIGIVRNPLAVLASWIKAPKEFREDWDVRKEWRNAASKNESRPEEFFGFEKWKETTENFVRFEREYPRQFMIVRYDRLNENPLRVCKDLFEFCNLSIHPQVSEFIENSRIVHDDDAYSVFRAGADDNQWQKVLPADIVNEVRRELNNSSLQTFFNECI